MTGVIKSQNLAALSGVRPFEVKSSVAEVVALARHDEESERLRRKVSALEGEIRQHKTSIETLRGDVERAFEDGKAKGRDIGLAEAQDRQSERLAALEAGIQAARSEVSGALASLERLAPLLAQECLDRIFGAASDRSGMVAEIVAAQMARIDRGALLRIDVSRRDFPQDDALAALAQRLSLPSTTFDIRDDMASGGCVMVLQLGRMVVGVDQQWGALREMLGTMAEPAP